MSAPVRDPLPAASDPAAARAGIARHTAELRMPRRHRSPGRVVAVTLGLTALGLALAVAVQPWLDTYTVLPSITAIVVAAWYGGLRPGLAATFLSIVGIDLLLVAPIGEISLRALGISDVIRLLFFLLAAIGASVASGALWRSQRATSQALDQLAAANADLLAVNEQLQQQATELEITNEQLQEQAVLLEERAEEAMALTRELQSANAELASTTYSIAHDLRSPLRAIDGYSRIIMLEHSAQLDEEPRRLLGRVRANAQRMGELIDGILALARLGRGDLQHGTVALAPIVRAVVDDLRRAEPVRQVTVEVDPALVVRGDARLLTVVLQNLLGNAWKFTRPRAHAHIAVERDAAGESPGTDAFVVRDDGVGFDPEFGGQLFQPFQRLHDAREFEGHGIGLATVRRIVERHGGRVRAEGRPGEGAAFHVALPRAARDGGGGTVPASGGAP